MERKLRIEMDKREKRERKEFRENGSAVHGIKKRQGKKKERKEGHAKSKIGYEYEGMNGLRKGSERRRV